MTPRRGSDAVRTDRVLLGWKGSEFASGTGKELVAAMVKVIEVLAESEVSWDDAANVALKEASKTLRNIKSIYVKEMQAVVENDRIVKYRINAKVSFLLDPEA